MATTTPAAPGPDVTDLTSPLSEAVEVTESGAGGPSSAAPVGSQDKGAASGLRRIAAISASLVSTYALTSVLGIAFWLLAARQFSVAAVGVGGAAISMMTLLGTLGTCGLGTLLIARLPLTPQGERRVLTRTALAVAGVVTFALAFVVPFVAIHILHVGNLDELAGSPTNAVLFAAGTALMAVGIVIDQAVLVLGSGSLQTERNAVASLVKVLALLTLVAVGTTGWVAIFLAWAIGTLASLPLVAWRTRGGRALQDPGRLFDLARLRGLGRLALSHHALNTTLQAPLQLLPLLVLVVVSSRDNGIFTSTLQVTGIVFTLPYAITVGLFASADGQESNVLERMRFTLPVSLGISVLANLLLFPLAPFVLSIFGSAYSAEGVDVLRVLALAGIPFVVKDHFVALRRVQNRTGSATKLMVLMTLVELAAAYVGARTNGALGLTIAWVTVLAVEALVLAVPLAQAARPRLLGRLFARVPVPSRRTLKVGQATTVDPATLLYGVAETTPQPTRWRRALTLAGAGPAVLVMAAGLLPMAIAVSSARTQSGDGQAQLLYVVGLLVIFVPAVVGVLMPHARTSTRVLLALSLAMLLQLARLVLYPTRFMFHDELIHANVLRLIGDTGQLFTPNTLLPITSYYPGLEVATNAVQTLLGLSPHTAAVVVLVAARVVMSLGVLLLVAFVTRSRRIGATALVIYACNPQMLFFNSQYSYQTLALPLAIFAVYLVATRRVRSRSALVPGVLAIVAVAFTHHVTTVLLILTFTTWWLIDLVLGRRAGREGANQSRRYAALPLLGMVLASAGAFVVTLLNPGNSLIGYLSAIGESSAEALGAVLGGTQQRKVFQNSAGVLTQPWEQAAIIGSLVLTLAILLPALWRARTLLRTRVSIVVLLLAIAVLYPLIPGGHLTVSTAEVGDRSAGFVFLGVAFAVAWFIWQHRMRWWKTALLSAGASVVFLGSIVLGAGSISAQLPGPFRVSDDARSIDGDNLAAAYWMADNLPAESVVYADRIGGLLAAADGKQETVTHIGTGIDASRLLLDPDYGQADIDLIRAAHIRYLVADRRDANGLPNQDVYIENGEFGSTDRTAPPPEAALRKFSQVPGVDVIYDNGSIVIYDLEALDVR